MFATPKRSALLSWLLHCGAILLILAVTGVKPNIIPVIHEMLVAPATVHARVEGCPAFTLEGVAAKL